MPDLYGQALAELPIGYEVINLVPPESVRIHVVSWLLGYRVIHVGSPKRAIEHVALGLAVVRLDKPTPRSGWCFTSSNLVAELVPMLENPRTAGQVITISAFGAQKSKHYQVEVTPDV